MLPFDAAEELITSRPLSDVLRFAATRAELLPVEEEGVPLSDRPTEPMIEAP